MKLFLIFCFVALFGLIAESRSKVLRPEARIVGGHEVEPNSIPYQVGLVLKIKEKFFGCGATVLSNEYIVTAAHCVATSDWIKVFLGKHNMSKDFVEPGQIELFTEKKDWIIHPEWDSKTFVNDIALIKLPERIEYTDKIQPINLPKHSQEKIKFEKFFATASGWGKYSDESPNVSDILRSIDVYIMPNDRCEKYYPNRVKPTMVCTSGSTKLSTCQGDSGGPLTIEEKDGSRTLIGVTSMVSRSGCEQGNPPLFTRVTSYLDWISEVTGIKILS